ncbi:uncharacterized protein BX663DRAFT_552092 [Cokeromyces recurvatus]|uniref:uncharacterized protein n=1 Tax=Cokeromyces recurvatus TaxID=90255 RepID=UPI00221F7B2D|nr:uncharacterized protein BX663DRAFT_552092 [Cokeromyces recurvatus]KAI7902687.1 hypothetical protein BX663DRAFT_552092 [Cokeromyces recurvatus]
MNNSRKVIYQIGEHSNEETIIADKSEPSLITSISLSSTGSTSKKAKRFKHCSLAFKIIGLFMIIGIVLIVAFLPNYIRNKNLEKMNNNNTTDPTNAQLPKNL